MELLLSTNHLNTRAGSETYLLMVAVELQRLGHDVTVHSISDAGESTLAGEAGLAYAAGGEGLPERVDAVIVQDGIVSYTLAERYPEAPQLFVAHSAVHDLQLPPQLPGVVQAVVALSDRVLNRLQTLAVQVRVTRLRQPVELWAFSPHTPVRARPRRALVLSNRMPAERRKLLEDVFGRAGIKLDVAGLVGRPTRAPAAALAGADIVVGYGRCIVEAMACGRAAYVFDHAGGDGWVTPDSYARLEADGFGGRAGLGPIDAERLAEDLDAYDADMGRVNRDLAVLNHGADRHAQELLGLVAELVPPTAVRGPSAELARLVRNQWVTECDRRGLAERLAAANGAQQEAEELRERVRVLEADHAASLGAERQLAAVLATRRYRLGAALGRVVDSARVIGRLGRRPPAGRAARP